MPLSSIEKPFLTLREVGAILRRSVRTVNRIISDRELEAHKFRGRWVVKPECLEQFIQKLKTNL